jgi:hypothetical protein
MPAPYYNLNPAETSDPFLRCYGFDHENDRTSADPHSMTGPLSMHGMAWPVTVLAEGCVTLL